jgi:hypothetical protein
MSKNLSSIIRLLLSIIGNTKILDPIIEWHMSKMCDFRSAHGIQLLAALGIGPCHIATGAAAGSWSIFHAPLCRLTLYFIAFSVLTFKFTQFETFFSVCEICL